MTANRRLRPGWVVVALLCYSFFQTLTAQTLRQKTYAYFVADDLVGWKSTIDSVQRTGRMTEATLLDLINSQYGYVASLMAKKRNEEADAMIRVMSRNVELLSRSKQFASDYYAYSALCTMFQIPKNLFKAPSLAKQFSRQVDQSMAINPQNPLAVSLKAGGYYYRPKAFGGDKELAMELYKKSETLYYKEGAAREKDWNLLGLLITMAKSYEAMGNQPMAQLYQKKLINMEPLLKRRVLSKSDR